MKTNIITINTIMKQYKNYICLFLLLIGMGMSQEVFGTDVEYAAVHNKPSNTKDVCGDGTWMASTGMHAANTNGVYWSVSTGTTPVKITDITNTEYTSRNVTKIVVAGKRNRDEAFTIDATVGGNAFGSQYEGMGKSSGNDSYTATFNYPSGASGNIVLTLRTQGGGSIWVNTITVTYSGVELHYGPNGETVTTIGVGENFPSVDDIPGWLFDGKWATSADQDCEPAHPSGSTYASGTAAASGIYYALYQGDAYGCNNEDYSCKPTPTYVLTLENPSSGAGFNWVVADVGCGPVGTTITLTYTINVGGTSYQGATITRDDNSAAVSFTHDAEEQTITFDLPASDVTATVDFVCPDLTDKSVTINDIVPYYDAGAWKANVTWNAVSGATEYGIQVNDITGSSTFLPATAQPGTSRLLSGLTEGHTYRAIIQANNPCASGNHTPSATKNFTPECPALEGTLAIALDEVTSTGASISWNGATTAAVPTGSTPSNAILYDVKITKSGGADGGILNVTDVDYTEWTNSTPLETGSTYSVQVTAKNVCGETMAASRTFKCKAYEDYLFTCADLSLTDEDGTHAPIWITSTAGKMVRSQKALHIEGTGLKPNGAITFTIGGVAANNCASGDVFAIRQANGSAVAADGSGEIDMDVYVFYQPSGGTDGLDLNAVGTAIVATSAEGTVPPAVREYKAMSATLANVAINGRRLPSQFVVAGKKNNKWYAMPANMASTTNPKPSEIAVDDINNPSIAYTATSNIYTMEGPTAANISGGKGDYIRFVMMPLWVDDNDHEKGHAPLFGRATGENEIGKSGNSQATSDLASGGWWWKLVQTNTSVTNPQDTKYTIYNHNNTSSLSLRDNSGNPDWGLFASGVEVLRLIPASDIPFTEADVVEWGQHAAIIEVDATAATGIDASSVIAHLGAASSSAIELVQTGTSVKGGDTKYNYTVNFGNDIDFAAAASNGAMLTLEWKKDATVKAMSNIIVPKIVATNATMSSLMATDDPWNSADVHVLPGVTLTANAGDFSSKDVVVDRLEIYPGATVKVTKGSQDVGTLKVRTLVLRNGWTRVGSKNYDVARLYVSTDANLAKNAVDNVWYSDWYIDYDQYYPIAVPFWVATSSITYKNTKSTATAGVKIRYYDGARRAEHVQQDQADNWVEYTWGGTMPGNLEPSKGYAMTAKRPSGKAFSIVRMPMTFTNPWTALGEHGYVDETHKDQVTVTGWGKGTTPWYAMGWNFIGNPYMCTFNGNDDGISGKITTQEGGSIKYATIPDLEFKNFYQVPIAEADLKPASGFFIQAEDADPQTITFNAGKIVPPSAPTRYTTTEVTIPEQEAFIRLSNGAEKDLMGLIIGEDYTEAYEPNADLAKMLGDANAVKTYMQYGDMDMAYVAINAMLAKEWIPVTVKIPADGEYTFALTNSSTVDALEGVYLIDYANGDKVTNLIEEDYIFVAETGTISGRFAINAIFGEHKTPTGIDAVQAGADMNSDKPFKFVYHDKVYILHRGVIYDSTGKKVREINK